jgi:hypothetical protein
VSKHIIFLVHGMGDFKEKWSTTVQAGQTKSVQALIKEKYKSWPQVSWVDFDNNFEFCEINYNKEFEALREQWKDSANKLSTALSAVGISDGIINKLTSFADFPSKDTFTNTHVLDVILYRYIKQITATVRSSVITQILAKLSEQSNSNKFKWSIISHSLGTAVTHDALHALYTAKIDDLKANNLGKITFPTAVIMLANVSHVLENDFPVYKSALAPGAPGRSESACRRYLNIRHEWDPIPAVKKFNPTESWPDPAVRNKNLYKEVLLKAINPPDARVVHDFEHYLDNPKCHAALFGALVDNFDQIPTSEVAKKHQAYVNKIDMAWQEKAKEKLLAFKLREGEDDLGTIFAAWAGFLGKELS